MPGFQVAGRVGGGNNGTSQHTRGTQMSLFLSPFTTFLFALSDFPFSCFLKREVSFGPKCENVGNWCWGGFGIRGHYFNPELFYCLSLCCCNIIARASFVTGLFVFLNPYFIYLFSTAKQWEPKCGEGVWKCFLPGTCTRIQTHIVYEISDVYAVGWSWCRLEPPRRSKHFIWPPDLSFIRG